MNAWNQNALPTKDAPRIHPECFIQKIRKGIKAKE
jgi:hypothetical protein